MSKNKSETLLARTRARLENMWFVAAALLLIAAVVLFANFTEAVDKLLVWSHLRPDALSLTRESQRDELSREFTRAAWRRLFWMRAYLRRVELEYPKEEQDFAWSKHIEASEDWASLSMVFIVALERFYGPAKAACLEQHILPQFLDIGDRLAEFRKTIRFDGSAGNGAVSIYETAIKTLRSEIGVLNADLYYLVRGFPLKANELTGCTLS